jgi:hypothetical protein
MTAASNEVVAVIQADIDLVEALAALRKSDGIAAAQQIVARHRLAHSDPRPVAEGLREAAIATVAGAADYVVRFEAALAGQKDDPSASLAYLASQAEVAVRYIKRLLATHGPAPMAGEVATGEDQAFIFDVLEALKPHFPEISFCFARGTGGIERQDILAILDGRKPATSVSEVFDLDGLKKLWRTGVEAGRILQDAESEDGESAALNLLRSREIQAIGAAISNRNWHDLESAYNQGRDRLDSILTARKLRERRA